MRSGHEFNITDGPSVMERQRYQADIIRFRKRKRLALIISIVSLVASVTLIALGGALALGSFNRISGEYLAQRHAPGQDHSVSLPRGGAYAITSTDPGRDLPDCTVTDLAGTQLPVTRTVMPGDTSTQILVFEATKGGHLISCDGGNAGIVAYAMDELDIVANGWRGLLLGALPFIGLGLACYFGGRVAAKRVAPEAMRPIIPS